MISLHRDFLVASFLLVAGMGPEDRDVFTQSLALWTKYGASAVLSRTELALYRMALRY